MKVRVRKFTKKDQPEHVEVKGHKLSVCRKVPSSWNGEMTLKEMVDLFKREGKIVAVVRVMSKAREFIYTN